MTLREWLNSLAPEAMVSSPEAQLSWTDDGGLACSSYWWSPREALYDWDDGDLDEDGILVTLRSLEPGAQGMECWAGRLSTGRYFLTWAALIVPEKPKG